MQADKRWANADPTVISLELLTVFIGAPLCFYICSLLAKGDRAAHFWIVVLSTGELYGGWMTFCPVRLRGRTPAHGTGVAHWLAVSRHEQLALSLVRRRRALRC